MSDPQATRQNIVQLPRPEIRKSLGCDLPVTLHAIDAPRKYPKRMEPPSETPNKPNPKVPAQSPKIARFPLIVYLKNLTIPRLGTTPDDELIASFGKRGFLVAEVDYQNQPMGRTGRVIFEEYCHLWMSFGAYCFNDGNYPTIRSQPNEKSLPHKWTDLPKNDSVDFKKYPIDGHGVYVIPAGYDLITL
jgi:hypothetical protein